jgi:hypothetical protein
MLDVDARHRDHLFLLGLAPLALACSVGVPDDGPSFTSTPPSTPSGGDAADDDTGEGTGGSSAEGDTAGPDDGMSVSVSASVGDDDTTSDGSASMSASVSVSVSVGDESTSYDYTSGPPPYGSACEAYGYVWAACYYGGDPMAAAMETANCEEGLSYFSMMGAACGMAFEDVIVCISELSCQELEMIGQGACDNEVAAFNVACP